MVKLTLIARVTDGLPLAEGLDDGREQNDMEFYKQQAKQLCKELSRRQHEASRMSVETGPYFFQYPFARVCGHGVVSTFVASARFVLRVLAGNCCMRLGEYNEFGNRRVDWFDLVLLGI